MSFVRDGLKSFALLARRLKEALFCAKHALEYNVCET